MESRLATSFGRVADRESKLELKRCPGSEIRAKDCPDVRGPAGFWV